MTAQWQHVHRMIPNHHGSLFNICTFIMIFSFGVSTSLTFKLLGEHLAAQFIGNGSLRASKAYIQPSGAYHFVPLTSMAYIFYLYMFAMFAIYDIL